jgi:hypothetical protein
MTILGPLTKSVTPDESNRFGPEQCPTAGCTNLEDQWCMTSQCETCVVKIEEAS